MQPHDITSTPEEEAIIAQLVFRAKSPLPKQGDRFGRLEFDGTFGCIKIGVRPQGNPIYELTCRCRCDCGTVGFFRWPCLRHGRTKSCKCLQIDYAVKPRVDYYEGKRAYTLLKYVWLSMIARCHDPKDRNFGRYGGRGILVCDEWRTDFNAFREWAHESGYRQGLSIDRENNDSGYSPDNCRWTTKDVQSRNTRQNIYLTAWGETKILLDWVNDPRCKVGIWSFRKRIAQGESPESAMTRSISRKRVRHG